MSTNETAETVLIAHQRHRGGCLCGWAELGRSHPGHQVAMLREAGLLDEGERAALARAEQTAARVRAYADDLAGGPNRRSFIADQIREAYDAEVGANGG